MENVQKPESLIIKVVDIDNSKVYYFNLLSEFRAFINRLRGKRVNNYNKKLKTLVSTYVSDDINNIEFDKMVDNIKARFVTHLDKWKITRE